MPVTGLGDHVPEVVQLVTLLILVGGSYFGIALKLKGIATRMDDAEKQKITTDKDMKHELDVLDIRKMNKDACAATHSGLATQMASLSAQLLRTEEAVLLWRRKNGVEGPRG